MFTTAEKERRESLSWINDRINELCAIGLTLGEAREYIAAMMAGYAA